MTVSRLHSESKTYLMAVVATQKRRRRHLRAQRRGIRLYWGGGQPRHCLHSPPATNRMARYLQETSGRVHVNGSRIFAQVHVLLSGFPSSIAPAQDDVKGWTVPHDEGHGAVWRFSLITY